MGTGSSCPAKALAWNNELAKFGMRGPRGLHTKGTQCESRVPPLAAHGDLYNMRQHREEEDDGEDDSGSKVRIIAIGWSYRVRIVGDASFATL